MKVERIVGRAIYRRRFSMNEKIKTWLYGFAVGFILMYVLFHVFM